MCEMYGDVVICRSPLQPAIMYTDVVTMSMDPKDDMVIHGSIQPFEFIWADCCRKKRWAAYLDRLGGGWYDPQFYCVPGYGCKTRAR